MWYYRIKDKSDELYHHGIKGQKWGDKNGPPYPLGASSHSSSEKKEGTKGWTTEAKAEHKSSGKSSASVSKKPSPKEIEDYKKQMVRYYGNGKPEKAKEYSQMTDEQLAADKARKDRTKKIIIGTAAVVGISAGVYLAYKYNATDRIKNVINENFKNANLKNNKSFNKQVNKALKDSIDDVDYIFEKGHEFHRQVGFENFDLKKTAGQALYTTTNKADTAAYKAFLKDWSRTGKRYDVTLESLKEIKAPSDKKARQIFDDLFDNNDEYRMALSETIAKHASKDKSTEAIRKLSTNIHDNMDKYIGNRDEIFKQGMYEIVKQGKDSKILMDAYRKAGYDAIIDYFDKGEMSKQPLIFFDADKVLYKKGQEFVDKASIRNAVDYLAGTKGHPLSETALRYKTLNAYDLLYGSIFGTS